VILDISIIPTEMLANLALKVAITATAVLHAPNATQLTRFLQMEPVNQDALQVRDGMKKSKNASTLIAMMDPSGMKTQWNAHSAVRDARNVRHQMLAMNAVLPMKGRYKRYQALSIHLGARVVAMKNGSTGTTPGRLASTNMAARTALIGTQPTRNARVAVSTVPSAVQPLNVPTAPIPTFFKMACAS